jgi:hypothetical protein
MEAAGGFNIEITTLLRRIIWRLYYGLCISIQNQLSNSKNIGNKNSLK